MATLKTFRFDTDFDDVQLMEKIVKEENEKVEDGNTLLEPEPEIVAPTYSEDDLEAARQAGFNAGKENGIKETLAGIENIIAQTLDSIVIEMSELSQRQTEFNEQIKIETILLINSVNRKLFPLMNESCNLDETIRFSEEVLPQLLTEPRITIHVPVEIADTVQQRIQQFLHEKNYSGELSVRGDVEMSTGICKIEWSSGSAERNTEMLLSEIEKRFLTSIENEFVTETINDVASAVGNLKTEEGISKPEATHQTVDLGELENERSVSEEISVDEPSKSEFENKEINQEEGTNSSYQNHVESENNS